MTILTSPIGSAASTGASHANPASLPTAFDALRKDFLIETRTLRTFLERLPYEQLDWRPHPKSMTLRSLAIHLAEIAGWPATVLTTPGIDFAAESKPKPVAGKSDLLILLDKGAEASNTQMAQATTEQLQEEWPMRLGERVLASESRLDNIRHSVNQIIHHRAQMGVYFRLLDIPVPASLGPTADDMGSW